MDNSKTKILLVDDEEVHSLMLEKGLNKLGFSTHHVLSGEEAIRYFEDNQVDIVLLDLIMPGISGIGVLKWLRNKYEQIELPIIVITTETHSDSTVEALKNGANDYLIKPIDFSSAVARLNTQLKIVELSRNLAMRRELNVLDSMILTYSHEINNPLTIAMGNLPSAPGHIDEEQIQKIRDPLERIASLIKKIDQVKSRRSEKVAGLRPKKILKED